MRTLGVFCLIAAAAMLAGCDGSGAHQGGVGNGHSSAATPLERNLLINGDAEGVSQTAKDVPETWTRTVDVVAMSYGGVPDEWQTSRPGCPDGRERYFRLALSINEPTKFISQRIGLTGLDSEVDAGHVECALGGWFGGWVRGDASARLEVDFVNADGAVIGNASTEAPDPSLLPRPETGRASMTKEITVAAVPPGTRRLDVRLTAVRPDQRVDTNAVALADSLSIVLRKRRDEPAFNTGNYLDGRIELGENLTR
jgi:hypothetical protein